MLRHVKNSFHDLRYFSIVDVCKILAAILIPLRHQVQRSLEGRLRYFTIQKLFADNFFSSFSFYHALKTCLLMFSNVLYSERKRMILAFIFFCRGSNPFQLGQAESVLSRITYIPRFQQRMGPATRASGLT